VITLSVRRETDRSQGTVQVAEGVGVFDSLSHEGRPRIPPLPTSSSFASCSNPPVQPEELIRLYDAAMFAISEHAAGLMLEPEGELLDDPVAIAADPPAAGNRAVFDLHGDAVECRASLLVSAAQLY
jgi:hypothetical protein